MRCKKLTYLFYFWSAFLLKSTIATTCSEAFTIAKPSWLADHWSASQRALVFSYQLCTVQICAWIILNLCMLLLCCHSGESAAGGAVYFIFLLVSYYRVPFW